jgi:glutamine synthetase
VLVEQYVTTINIEGETAASLARTALLPAAVEWARALDDADEYAGVDRLKGELSTLLGEFVDAIFALEDANANHPHDDRDLLEHAQYVQGTVIPAMEGVRAVADKLERIVPDTLWPLPKYSEILFIK